MEDISPATYRMDSTHHDVQPPPHKPRRIVLAISLFALTFISTLVAGTQWAGKNPFEISNWQSGLMYSSLLLLFLTAHELGHYFAAKKHGVDASLPYFLPMPLFFLSPFGTFGAFIRTRTPILSRKALFDIGVAGPLAGFVVCFVILAVGLLTLPPVEYLYSIHPEYQMLGGVFPGSGMRFGDTLLLPLLERLFASPSGFMPPMNEIYHYPFLCVGWFGMFVTALNMLPFGQLDGGHIFYAMFGERQRAVGRIFWWLIVALGLGGVFGELRIILVNNSPDEFYTVMQSLFNPVFDWIQQYAPWYFEGWNGWLFWAFIGRIFVKIPHPPLSDSVALGKGRMAIGWAAIIAFVLCFSYNGLIMNFSGTENNSENRRDTVVQQHLDCR